MDNKLNNVTFIGVEAQWDNSNVILLPEDHYKLWL